MKPLLEVFHQCQAPGCTRRIAMHYFCCGQHRSLLGWVLSCDMQTAWRERAWNRDNYESKRRQALRSWGWTEEERREHAALQR